MSEGKLLAGAVTIAISIGLFAVGVIIQGDARQPLQSYIGVTWCFADKAKDNEA